ncbi:MAG: hypothetical protein OEO23_14455, partial [Gemmatimonadota bacterium]|nr:hypothetical protein [Gemmatimonadota bacterium]
MLNVTGTVATADDSLQRSIVRSAALAVERHAPLEVIDPRGMIYDKNRDHRWTLRLRGCKQAMVLGLPVGIHPLDRPDQPEWTVFSLSQDEALPGHTAMAEPGALGALVELDGPLSVTPATYRRGRRAVFRIGGARSSEARYLKLLSKKAFRRAAGVMDAVGQLGLDDIVRPVKLDRSMAALVFDEVAAPSLHDRLWAGSEVAVDPVLDGVARLAGAPTDPRLPRRNLLTEREGTVRLLTTGASFLPALNRVLTAIEDADLPQLEGKGLIHGDFHDKQIFVEGCSVRMIDAESLAIGPPEIDLVNLAEHLRLRGLQGCEGAPDWSERLWGASGLDRSAPHVAALRALVRARLSGVYAKRPWWWKLALRLADESIAML